jgi:hypothetical protein
VTVSARERLTTGPDEPLTIAKADGRVWRINVPRPGRVTVEYPDERPTEELSIEELVAREQESEGSGGG